MKTRKELLSYHQPRTTPLGKSMDTSTLKRYSRMAKILASKLPPDFVALKQRSLVHMHLFEALLATKQSPELLKQNQEYNNAHQNMESLEELMYPLNKKKYPHGVRSLYDSFIEGRGLVMSSGNWHYR